MGIRDFFRLERRAPAAVGAWATDPSARRFDAIWRVCTLLLVLLGFLALCLTGELHLFAVVLFLLFWFVALLRPPMPAWWRPWLRPVLFWLFLGTIALLSPYWRFISLLYLLMFLAMFKSLTLREPVDHVHAMLMAFFMLLACSIITNSASYILFMVGFVVLVMLELVCCTIAREVRRTRRPGPDAAWHGPVHEPSLFRRLVVNNLIVGLVCVLIAFGLFFVIPHYSTQHGFRGFSTLPAEEGQAVSGFSEDLSLNVVNRLMLDNTRVMTVQPRWLGETDEPLPTQLWLRGSTLAIFDEEGWRSLPSLRPLQSNTWQVIRMVDSTSEAGPVLDQKITQNLQLVRRLFGAGDPRLYMGLQPSLPVSLNWEAQSVDFARNEHIPSVSYRTQSILMPNGLVTFGRMVGAMQAVAPELVEKGGIELTRALREVEPHLPRVDPELLLTDEERELYTALPEMRLTQIVRSLAEQHAGGANVAEDVVNLYRWLQRDYRYSLEPETPAGLHPLEAFLTYTRKGHCEYFASVMALLLRARGIPARIVTGYYATEFNNVALEFQVRQSDAHAWCEVWVDGWGWLTLDPTPPDYRGSASLEAYQPLVWRRMRTAIRAMWQRHVLDYSNSDHTLRLIRMLQRPLGDNLNALRRWSEGLLINKLADGSVLGRGLWTIGELSVLPLLKSGVAILLLVGLWVLYRRSLRIEPRVRRYRSPVGFVNVLLRRLEAMGWKRRPEQTVAEFILQVERELDGRWSLAPVVDLYHRCRFAGENPSTEELAQVERLIRSLHK